MGDLALIVGNEERTRLMRDIAEAYERDEWPGYENPDEWTIPDWYANRELGEVTLQIGTNEIEL